MCRKHGPADAGSFSHLTIRWLTKGDETLCNSFGNLQNLRTLRCCSGQIRIKPGRMIVVRLETLTAATLALATFVVVSTAFAAVAPDRDIEPAAITCVG